LSGIESAIVLDYNVGVNVLKNSASQVEDDLLEDFKKEAEIATFVKMTDIKTQDDLDHLQ
jgi:hypothetical protein